MALPAPDPAATCLITGASSGLGAEFARQLARAGHGVTLVARREDRLRELATRLERDHGVRAEALPCDLTDQDARAELPRRVAALGLRVDLLVNNAGFATGGKFHRSDPGQELRQVQLLCEAPVALHSAFLPAMVERRGGAIVNVASTAGMQPLPNSAGYGAAKAYLLSFSEAVHAEVRKHGVTVTALCPGPVRTELFEKEDHPVEGAPAFAWKESPEVVAAALDGVRRGKRVVIPGLLFRAAMPVSRLTPKGVLLPIAERFFR